MCEYEKRNLAIIETIMNELGVSDIEELPAKVHEIREHAEEIERIKTALIKIARCTSSQSIAGETARGALEGENECGPTLRQRGHAPARPFGTDTSENQGEW